ncbi:MAG: FKBP-type peptidyl-prolyl cis-trans isomerase [Acidobacteriaceae bacterium]|nr:FKBP-type peptidyl-prolyl cis-trans isomerase [Acidobacteriaceae bacterium]
MKTTFTLSALAFAIAVLPVSAQTASPATASAAPAKKTVSTVKKPVAATACVKLPEISAKVPALPAGQPCAKPIYTITSTSPAKLSDVSPLFADSIRETLGIQPVTFTLSYIDVKVGTGELAAPHKSYSVKYTGYLADGTKFDSSEDHPDKAAFVLRQGQHEVIPGWDTGFYGMRIGGKRRLFIPWQLAYGTAPHGNIPGKSELIFDIELVGQSDKAPEPPAAAVRPNVQPGTIKVAPAPAAAPATPKPATPVTAPTPTTAPASPAPTTPKP